ncbi:hypothetical protein KCMC57_up54460 [Kitasatospora sp. CMC57]|uniref:Mce-associated membrane protein n=1 Tax=Kitasatospora sp. CMC57 TaxID=3231513 RepID=A0AB33K8H3_9ACTN
MSTTTRHLINRQRRLAATRPPVAPAPAVRPPRRRRLPAVLLALAVLSGGFGAWSAVAAADLRADAGLHNTALSDPAATSEVKGRITEAVNALFSFTHADPARTDQAAHRLLTGRAVEQHATLLAQVRAQAAAKKLVLTTTVTDAAVTALDGDRARVLVFADQRNTSTADGATDAAGYSAAMFAVDAVRTDGSWRIENIDTYGR